MADYYLRQWGYPTYAAVPSGASWPLDAQDGDGLASGIAVSAVASIDFASITAAAGNTIAVLGAVLTCVASGASANQFNAASGATLATNVAAAINAATATVSSAVSAATPQLRDMVYARVNPGLTTQVQIMTRAGSATLNTANNAAAALAQSGMSASLVQFSGGQSGAWGYLWNASPAGTSSQPTIWPSGKAVNSYGVAFSEAAKRPLVGPVLSLSDTVHMRADGAVLASGVLSSGVNIAVTAWINLLVDDGTVWPGQSGTVTVRMELSDGSNWMSFKSAVSVSPARALTFGSRTPYKLIFELAGTAGNSGGFSVGVSDSTYGAIAFANVLFRESTASTNAKLLIDITNHSTARYVGCKFQFNRNYFYSLLNVANSSVSWKLEIIGAVFEWTALATSAGALLQMGSIYNAAVIRLLGCEAVGASPQVASIGGNRPAVTLTAKNLKGFSLTTTLLGYMGDLSGNTEDAGYCLYQNVGSNKGMRLESTSSVLDWNPDGGYPTLSAVLQNGLPWAYRLLLSSSENAIRYGGAAELVCITQAFEAADAVASLALEMLVPGAYAAAITKGHFALLISYTDTNGAARSEFVNWSLRPLAETATLDASAASWALGSYGTHVAKKLAFSTQYAVKQWTELEATLFLRRPMPALLEVFVNPALVAA